MKEHILISPPQQPIKASIRLPNSKSISNRVLVMAALGGFRHALQELSDADDTQRLDHLVNERPREMDCGAGGTTLRFLLAWASIQDGEEHLITGVPRLLERPHDQLVEALVSLGASIERVPEGFLVRGRKLKGGEVDLHSPVSSQYISALLLIAPYMEDGLKISWSGERVSEPYMRMTCGLMTQFGVDVKIKDELISVSSGKYSSERFVVPRDWSAASFWYQIVALASDAHVHLIGLFEDGIQGDAIARSHWQRWVITEMDDDGMILRHRAPTEPDVDIEYDLKDSPDLFQPLVFTCAAAGSPASFTGLQTLPLKETNRIQATKTVLEQLGAAPRIEDEQFKIPAWRLVPTSGGDLPILDPQGDHRMAMAIAPLSMLTGGIRLSDPQVVIKSYPYFWDHLEMAGFVVERVSM